MTLKLNPIFSKVLFSWLRTEYGITTTQAYAMLHCGTKKVTFSYCNRPIFIIFGTQATLQEIAILICNNLTPSVQLQYLVKTSLQRYFCSL